VSFAEGESPLAEMTELAQAGPVRLWNQQGDRVLVLVGENADDSRSITPFVKLIINRKFCLGDSTAGSHPFSFRTRKLSSLVAMVVRVQPGESS
jgi:hypothetical protein